jgi:hypothetical protein
MLARSFKTAVDLGISEKEHGALIQVLGMLERGELQLVRLARGGLTATIPNGFNMIALGEKNECGTVGCLLGWARFVTDDHGLFTRCWMEDSPEADALRDTFLWKDLECLSLMKYLGMSTADVSPTQAAHALSNYLTTGKPDWAEALKEGRGQ